jgi:signal transduction histidine kinase
MAYLGLLLDLFSLKHIHEIIVNNSVTLAIIFVSNLLFILRIIKLPLSFAFIVFALIANIVIGAFTIPFEGNIALLFFRDSFFVIYLMILSYLIINKTSGIIITFIYVSSFLALTITTHNTYLKESVFLILTVFIAFSVVSYFFVRSFEQSIKKQLEKNRIIEQQNKVVNETNSLLEMRQEQISKQTEELKSQKKILAKRNKELQELVATKDKFFSIIAHDLKNPMNALIGFSELLYKDKPHLDSLRREKMIELIYTNAKNTYKLLDNLLLWSRMQTGMIKENLMNVNIEELFEAADNLLKNMRKQKEIILSSDFAPERKVFADPVMISSVINNLLTNAIKFTPPEGRIHFSTQTYNNTLQVCISDTGIGIPKEEIPNLFNIDHSYTTEGTNHEKGTGLGLMLCKEFVKRNHGKIWVESNVNLGSKFYFTLKLFKKEN